MEDARKDIEDIKKDICDNYCKKPLQFSANEWEEMVANNDDRLPCKNCVLEHFQGICENCYSCGRDDGYEDARKEMYITEFHTH